MRGRVAANVRRPRADERSAGRVAALVVLLVAALGLGACGGGSGDAKLTVSAAASLQRAFTDDDQGARFSFAGSDELAAQIEQGVRPDVYAAADTVLPAKLHRKGLVGRPVLFAANELVLAVPAGTKAITSLGDLTRPGVTLAIGQRAVPVGVYTRLLLADLPAAERRAIEANVRSEEPDVGGIVGKLTQGAVDAGFVYRTDVEAAGGALKAIRLPRASRPAVLYAAAVVTGTKHPREARAFVDGLLHGAGARALRAAGFDPPPRR